MTAYYNEKDPDAAAWLRALIAKGHIAAGEVDERSIVDVRSDDLRGFVQCHFFAGIGGWSLALRAAGWRDDQPVWTGSCPCQPFSAVGRRQGFADSRHLWPEFLRLITERRPPIVFGEQVASAADWLGVVRGNLEAVEYAVGAMPTEAASAGADHLRDRFWFVAHSQSEQVGSSGLSWQRRYVGNAAGVGSRPRLCKADALKHRDRPTSSSGPITLADANEFERRVGDEQSAGQQPQHERDQSARDSWIVGADGKARRVKPGVRLLVNGFPCRVGLLRGFGNAIDPRPAATFIEAARDVVHG